MEADIRWRTIRVWFGQLPTYSDHPIYQDNRKKRQRADR